jgi:Tfp pilus assembly protein PilX
MKKNNGFALLIALIVAFIILVLGSMALYMSTVGTRMSGSLKEYRSAVEAAGGAFELTRNMVGNLKSNPSYTPSGISADIKTKCLNFKFNNPTAKNDDTGYDGWTNDNLTTYDCNAKKIEQAESLDLTEDEIKNSYDIKYSLGQYTVYVKVMNTTDGNTSINSNSGKNKNIGGVESNYAQATGGGLSTPKAPYLYRMEIMSINSTNKNNKAIVTLLYAY